MRSKAFPYNDELGRNVIERMRSIQRQRAFQQLGYNHAMLAGHLTAGGSKLPLALPVIDPRRFVAVRAKGHDVIRTMLTWRCIHIWSPPWICRNARTLQVRAVPARKALRLLNQHQKTLGRIRITPVVEIIEIERSRKAADLNPRRLHLRRRQITQHAWTYHRHE